MHSCESTHGSQFDGVTDSAQEDAQMVVEERGLPLKLLKDDSVIPDFTPTTNQQELIDMRHDECFLQTHSGNFKSYTLRISEGKIVLCRPSSTHVQEMSISLSTIQCIKSHTTKQVEKAAKTAATTFYCLLLVISTTQQRSVYFDSEAACDRMHKEILAAQGFLEERFKAYEPIGKLGEGSFGTVLLAKHRLSGVIVAVKMIPKKHISKVFDVNKVKFAEIEIMEDLMAVNCPNMLQLIESFTNEHDYFIVTQYMQTGSLYEYMC